MIALQAALFALWGTDIGDVEKASIIHGEADQAWSCFQVGEARKF